MTTIASQITSLTVIYSTVYSDADQRNIKVPRHWPLCGEFTGTGEFPAQRASYAENVSIWWRHHVLSLWRHDLTTFSAWLTLCEVYPPVNGGSLHYNVDKCKTIDSSAKIKRYIYHELFWYHYMFYYGLIDYSNYYLWGLSIRCTKGNLLQQCQLQSPMCRGLLQDWVRLRSPCTEIQLHTQIYPLLIVGLLLLCY